MAKSISLTDRIKYWIVKFIADGIFEVEQRKKLALITLGKDSKIYSETKIGNPSNAPSKIVIGKNSHVRGYLHNFWSGGKIEIGDFCYIGEDSRIWAANSVRIGNRVLIAHNVNIHDNISHPIDAELRHKDFKRILGLEKFEYELSTIKANPIEIEDDVWIGFNVIILSGVKIGKGAVIGAGAVVTHDVPEFAVVVGNPARIIRYLKTKTEI